jgi:hypothetical protein
VFTSRLGEEKRTAKIERAAKRYRPQAESAHKKGTREWKTSPLVRIRNLHKKIDKNVSSLLDAANVTFKISSLNDHLRLNLRTGGEEYVTLLLYVKNISPYYFSTSTCIHSTRC